MNNTRWSLRALFWIVVAMGVTWPASLSPSELLIGHPDVDIWNHAWGYWFIPHQLASFSWPFSTDLIGVPQGGDLYFIDLLGALIGAPLSWVFGPAVAYNAVMVARLAAAGVAGQALAETVLGRGPHTAVAGMGMITLPFLLAEMSNGISEVIAIHWIVWVLWAGWRVMEQPSSRGWMRLGILGGLATMASFYYGLVSVMMLGMLGGARLIAAWRAGWRPERADVNPILRAMGVSLLVALPAWLAFQWTLYSDNALIVRPKEFSVGWILRHNAVDPRTYIMPGAFQSVDLIAYGEAFVHTAYLRWTVLLLAIWGVIKQPQLRIWAVAAGVSLVLGLGPILYMDDWVRVGGHAVSLPFYWAQLLLPDVAITHPLRLSIGGQIVVVLLAAAGASFLRPTLSFLVACLIAVESLGFSAGPWPVPTSSTEVPSVYADAGVNGPVLDLPGSVGSTMATSRYFWYQTVHKQPIPYSPNVRLDSCRDLDVQSSFTDPTTRESEHKIIEHPGRGPDLYQKSLAQRYSAIVLHEELEERANLPSAYLPVLTAVFGPPTVDGPVKVWTFGDKP